MREIEVKAKAQDPEALVSVLKSKGCELSDPIVQSDVIFVTKEKAKDYMKFEPHHNLRLRTQNGETILTYKRPEKNEFDCLEFETTVGDPEQMEKILNQLGFHEVVRLKKIRRKGKLDGLEVCVDELSHLGNFIEIEKLVEDGNTDEIQEELFTILESLGVSRQDQVHHGYDTLTYQQNHGDKENNKKESS